MQAPTELTLSYTPFTDANFTEAILLNVTNTAYTGAVPEGDLSCNGSSSGFACHVSYTSA